VTDLIKAITTSGVPTEHSNNQWQVLYTQ